MVLVAAIPAMTVSCTSLRPVSPDALMPGGKGRIVRVEKSTGEGIRIHKGTYVRVVDGEVHIGGRIRVPGLGTKIVPVAGGYTLTPSGGPTYETDVFTSNGRHLIFTARTEVVIPVAEVAVLWKEEADAAKTMLAIAGGLAAVVGIGGLILAGMWNHILDFPGGL